jgi:hypothetical protein
MAPEKVQVSSTDTHSFYRQPHFVRRKGRLRDFPDHHFCDVFKYRSFHVCICPSPLVRGPLSDVEGSLPSADYE